MLYPQNENNVSIRLTLKRSWFGYTERNVAAAIFLKELAMKSRNTIFITNQCLESNELKIHKQAKNFRKI